MSVKYCQTCELRHREQNVCRLTGFLIDPEKDFCSKHADEIIPCDICGQPLLGSTYVEYDGEGNLLQYCKRCHQLFNTCQLCEHAIVCEFETNLDPMPKVVMKTVRQGNMMMQTQVKNEERVRKFCPTCACYDENHGCMKEFNTGCYKQNIKFS